MNYWVISILEFVNKLKHLKKVLILGGTQFIGRNLIELLTSTNEFEIVLFNRQSTNAHLFPDLRKIKGDRETNDIEKVIYEDWDCIIDLSSFFPNSLENLIERFKGRVNRYIFISSISVYDYKNRSIYYHEEHPTLPCNISQMSDGSRSSYGNRKAECERVLLRADWLDKIILRPAIVYGKYDPSDRLYYWLYRSKFNKNIFIPNQGINMMSKTYIKDLIEIIKHAITIKNHSTIYNTVISNPISTREMLNIMCEINGTTPHLISANGDEVIRNKIIPATDIPLWINDHLLISSARTIADFQIKPTLYQKSFKETNSYYDSLQWPIPKFGISLEREQELIDLLNHSMI